MTRRSTASWSPSTDPRARSAPRQAIELAELTGATLTALAVEGPLPAYAATIGEVDEVQRRRTGFLAGVVEAARADAEARGSRSTSRCAPAMPRS